MSWPRSFGLAGLVLVGLFVVAQAVPYVAPVSWLVQRDVDGGRSQFNFSEWDKPRDVSAGDLADAIRGGSMPPWYYTIPHPGAKLTKAEQDALVSGLVATLRRSPPPGGGG